MTKIIVAGGRDFNDVLLLNNTLENLKTKDVEIVCGEARGADSLGKNWAIENNKPVKSFPAEWDQYGKAAGYKRNEKMAEYADHLIAFWDNKSKGTKHMIDLARKYKLGVKIVTY
jgi:hypothetical protein